MHRSGWSCVLFNRGLWVLLSTLLAFSCVTAAGNDEPVDFETVVDHEADSVFQVANGVVSEQPQIVIEINGQEYTVSWHFWRNQMPTTDQDAERPVHGSVTFLPKNTAVTGQSITLGDVMVESESGRAGVESVRLLNQGPELGYKVDLHNIQVGENGMLIRVTISLLNEHGGDTSVLVIEEPSIEVAR